MIPSGETKLLHATQQRKKKKKVGPRIWFLSFLFTADHLAPKDSAYNRRAPEYLLSGCCRNFNMVPALSSLPEQCLLLKAGGAPGSTLAFNHCVEKHTQSPTQRGRPRSLFYRIQITKVLTLLFNSLVKPHKPLPSQNVLKCTHKIQHI